MRHSVLILAVAMIHAVVVTSAQECQTNEVYSECYKQCPPNTCAARGVDYSCTEDECLSGCVCAEGYTRDDSGACILQSDCSSPTACPTNEIHTDCFYACPPNTCLGRGATYNCPPYNSCLSGCVCAEGYTRDYAGTCILESDCPSDSSDYPGQ